MNKATEMQNWLALANRGDEFVYHTGLLAADREERRTGDAPAPLTARAAAANEAGNLAYALYGLKSVALVQRRKGFCVFDYVAVKQ